ncbi:glycosyltransferase family 4 protein [Limnoraphis robusta]|uniref:Glycosyl transferase n=1 Tax=Limnoraphis robusta CS-951 TaxID=1637645 RepID=A0A0F5YKR2_9CYAN|nr:glycosyltransferase family 4 protein [Limnoraphis robusta]KKD39242.1 glycosyl transferase [Limnoraphis robusta CS-951]KMW70940.1 glycosyl transferase [Limnoraphis robusta CS-951]
MNNIRIAWLLTSAFYYWHPPLAELAKLFPEMTAFVANWRGYAPGFEDSFKIDIVGERKIIPIIKSSKGYGYSFTYLPLNIVNRLLKFKPDVIFSNSFGVWTMIALLFKPIGKWKVVIAYEGSSPSIDARNSAPRLTVRRAMVKASDACITNSNAGKSYLTEVLNAKPSQVFVHPYEVPAVQALFSQSANIIDALTSWQKPIFLFVGSVIPRKGLNFLLDACTHLKKQGHTNYTVLIVGDGSQQEELQQFCQENDLTDCVQWVGRVNYGELGEYFQKADVFVLPTLEDTWGMVVLEAMILGKPILCSKWAGASELITDGQNGYCFDPYHPEQLANLMRCFIENPELVVSMGAQSEALMNQYAPDRAAQFLKKVTESLL